jgi:hypothetical protein
MCEAVWRSAAHRRRALQIVLHLVVQRLLGLQPLGDALLHEVGILQGFGKRGAREDIGCAVDPHQPKFSERRPHGGSERRHRCARVGDAVVESDPSPRGRE